MEHETELADLVCDQGFRGAGADQGTIEPDNAALQARIAAVEEARSNDEATVPSKLEEELETNPFLRARLPEVKALVGMPGAEDAAVFAEIRKRKDNF